MAVGGACDGEGAATGRPAPRDDSFFAVPGPDPHAPTESDTSSEDVRTGGKRDVHVVGAALLRGGRVLAARRAPHVSAAGKWEFPGGKVEEGESPRDALRRELREELGVDLLVGDLLGRGIDDHRRLRILLDVYVVPWPERDGTAVAALVDHDEIRWLGAEELGTVDWAQADRPVLPKLRQMLRTSTRGV